jgi:RsiW-degrading membrane proteinase PrsW (M82 family)
MLIAWRRGLRHNSELDGVVLGAAAGMGFAALESMGYAFTAFLGSRGSLSATVGITMLRGLLAPVGHGTWTAIAAGILFRESGLADFRVNRHVLLAYLGVSVLHGLWDGLPDVVGYVTGSGMDVLVSQVIIGAVGLIWLWRVWHHGQGQVAVGGQPALSGEGGAPTGG